MLALKTYLLKGKKYFSFTFTIVPPFCSILKKVVIILTWVAVGCILRPDAHAVSAVVGAGVDGPCAAPRDNHGLGPVVIVELWGVLVHELLAPDEKVVKVQVEHIVLPAVWGPRVPQAAGNIVKLGRHAGAKVVAVGPVVGTAQIAVVVVVLCVQQPDAGKAAGRDSVVKVVVAQGGDVVNGPYSVSALAGVVVAVEDLRGGLGGATGGYGSRCVVGWAGGSSTAGPESQC